jgi:hypothetical protein
MCDLSRIQSDPQYRALLRQMLIERQSHLADSAAACIGNWKEFGIECLNKNSLRERTLSTKEAIVIKEIYTKAIGMMASIVLKRPINAVAADNMYKVLIQEGQESDTWKRMHGERFPRDLTDAGWRSSFTALSDYIEGWID